MPKVLLDRSGPVTVLTLNRPEVRNAVDGPTAEALLAAWEAFRDDPEQRVLVLTGAGDAAFCAGADLRTLPAMGPSDPAERRAFALDGPGWMGFTRRLDVEKPVVAAVNGACLAGGLEVALVADLRIAEEHATFGVTNRKWGVPLVDGGTQRLPRVVGLGRALEMILTGRVLGAREAREWGLVTEVVPRGESRARAVALAEALAALPQEALRADLAATKRGLGRPLAEGLRIEAEEGLRAIGSPEFREAGARFAARPR